MPSTAISKRYPDFLTAFQDLVTAEQQRIRKVERQQLLYTIVREALHEADCHLDLGLHLSAMGVDLAGHVPADYHVGRQFNPIITRICELMRNRGIRDTDRIPQLTPSSHSYALSTSIHGAGGARLGISLWLDVFHGCADWHCSSETRTMTYEAPIITLRSMIVNVTAN